MTKSQLGALIRGLVPALRDYIAASQQPIHERLTTLETQERLVGAVGPVGPAGKDGKDGTLAGLTFEQLDERSWRFVLADGTPLATFFAPIVLDQGVYQAERTYAKGDGVTYAGSFWIAQDATREKPGLGATKWRLAVKAGRDGREGKGTQGPAGPQGPRGESGRDYR